MGTGVVAIPPVCHGLRGQIAAEKRRPACARAVRIQRDQKRPSGQVQEDYTEGIPSLMFVAPLVASFPDRPRRGYSVGEEDQRPNA